MSEYTTTIRHILEVRLKEKLFSFIDFRGSLIQFLIDNNEGDKIKYLNNGSRIDVANKDLTEVLFFSIDNFGFQIEATSSFEEFKTQTDKLFKIIDQFEKYGFKNVIRVGTKSIIYSRKKNKSLEALNTFFREKTFKDVDVFQQKSGSKVVDYGYIINDLEFDGAKASITTGPVQATEAIARFYNGMPLYTDVIKKSGLMFIMDCYRDNLEEKTLSRDEVKDLIFKNIEIVEKSFNGFRDFIFKEEDKKE